MSSPRLEIDLDKIEHNASVLVRRLKAVGISVTGVTKAFSGAPEIAHAMLRGGVTSLGDSRIENIELMRRSGIQAQMTLIRSPMMSQVRRVVASADSSLNTEIDVVSALSIAAVKARKTHGVMLMVELGDLREGIMVGDVERAVVAVRKLPNITFMGLGSNLACRNGVSPDNRNMAELSALANRFTESNGSNPPMVSGGNSSNLDWVFRCDNVGRVNNLRLGEAILMGREALYRKPVRGLHTDAISLIAEVIESKSKPSRSWGTLAQSAFNSTSVDRSFPPHHSDINQAILALGRQDTDPDGLLPSDGLDVLGASSDHLVLNAGVKRLPIGSNVAFQLNYSAFLRAMTSPHVAKTFIGRGAAVLPDHEVSTWPHAA
jgi:predicted amino acid racemase